MSGGWKWGMSNEERFWRYVDKTSSPSGCWLWIGSKKGNGYGQFMVMTDGEQKNTGAHIYAWELAHGPVPKGMCVCHNCPSGDNPACVNDAHLWLGTQAQNLEDASRKGHKNSLLSNKEADEVKRLLLDGARPVDVARIYKVSSGVICNIKKGVCHKYTDVSISEADIPHSPTLQEVGNLLGLTRQRVHQLRNKGLLSFAIVDGSIKVDRVKMTRGRKAK